MVEIFEEQYLYANFMGQATIHKCNVVSNVAAPPVIQKIIRKFLFKYLNLRK